MKLRRAFAVIGSTVRSVVRQFCENTSLHGLRYVYGGEKTGAELSGPNGQVLRTIWLLVCMVSIGFTTVMGMIAWMRFRTTPTITTIETMTYPIWNIPFPGVTVCNINKIDSRRAKLVIDQLVEEYGLSEENATGLLVAQVGLVNFEEINSSMIELEYVLGRMGWNPNTLLLELSQPCANLIKVCFWLGSEIPCSRIIRRTKTDNGFCCSYNVHQSLEPVLDKQNHTVPHLGIQQPYQSKRLSGAGRHVGLSLLIDIEPDTYMAPTRSYFGAEIYIHDSLDFPSDADFEHVAQPGWDVVMSVIPLTIESSSTMRQVPEDMRKCFLPEENPGEGNDINLNVCLAHCRLRTILKLCNCVPYYYSDIAAEMKEVKAFEMCALKHVACLRYFRRYFYSLRPDALSETDLTDVEFGMDCECKPPCSVLNYNVQTVASQRPAHRFVSSQYGGRDVSRYATLNVHFKDIYSVKYKRDAYMTWDSLVATFGGIFGLCMGGSVLSIVEMLYYFTVKPFTAYRHHRTRTGKRRNEPPRRNDIKRHHPATVIVRPSGAPYDIQRFPAGYFLRRNVLARARNDARNVATLGLSLSLSNPVKKAPSQEGDLSFIY